MIHLYRLIRTNLNEIDIVDIGVDEYTRQPIGFDAACLRIGSSDARKPDASAEWDGNRPIRFQGRLPRDEQRTNLRIIVIRPDQFTMSRVDHGIRCARELPIASVTMRARS
ncbi:MAG: hypothetical protein EA426_13915 [Spirochaetaceae bacterium]|nr:MAG: hypothetical protein EA426_13915 [Spirochaetaceae bacterium]